MLSIINKFKCERRELFSQFYTTLDHCVTSLLGMGRIAEQFGICFLCINGINDLNDNKSRISMH